MAAYDFLIVGAGLYGSVFAHQARKAGMRCLVIDKRKHAGGNVWCRNVDGINVHEYGAHIFHTNDEGIWNFVNSFVPFNHYINSPVVNHEGRLYNLPFNMNTFYQLWGTKTPAEAQAEIKRQIDAAGITETENLEQQALALVGTDIYEKFIKGYTEKQWGKPCNELPSFIIKRLPVRFTFDNNYFSDKYQGIPIGGYNLLIDGLLEGVERKLDTNYFDDRDHFNQLADRVVYTGALDEFYDYRFGELEYRSLRFEHQQLEIENFQGNAVINYTEASVPYTRILEHKHFEFGKQPHTVITHEYSATWSKGMEPFYPVNDEANMAKFKKYQGLQEENPDIIFGGRLAEYRYYDMHQVIGSALVRSKHVLAKDLA